MGLQRLARIYPMDTGTLAPPVAVPNPRTLDDRVGIHGVDPDAEWRPFKGETSRQMQCGGLRGRIGRGIQRSGYAVFRTDENDRAAPLQLHQGKRGARREDG